MTISSSRRRSRRLISMTHWLRRLATFLRPVFALDLRSLAIYRVGIATVILADLFWRLADVPAFLTDEGVLSRTQRLEMAVANDPSGYDYQWSFHLSSGHAWAQYVLMAVAAWFAIWLLVGYRTRLAAVLSWAMLVSLGNRNPLIYDGGDAVLRCLLFWSMFLPLGARLSFDARKRSRDAEPEPEHSMASNGSVVSLGSAAFMLQLLVVYLSAAIFKSNPVWLREFSGVYYALNCDPFATPLGLFVRNFPTVMKVLTIGTMIVELFGPIIVLMPFWNRWIRIGAVISFCTMHLAMAATMTLGIFPWICISAWLAFLPAAVWDRWAAKLQQRIARRWPGGFAANQHGTRNDRFVAPENEFPTSVLRRGQKFASRATQTVVAGLLVYAALWNLRDGFNKETAQKILPDRMNKLAQVLGLEKGWCMFAPVPRREDGWPIFKGTLHDGSEVNLWQPEEPIPWAKPRVVSAMYINQRWRRFLENMTMENYAIYRPYFSDWLQKRWNRQHARANPIRAVATVEILRQLETTPPPGEPIPTPETVALWTKHYPQ